MGENPEGLDTRRFADVWKLVQRRSEFNADEQNSLDWSGKKILVVGAGGLGCEILHCLALTGFKDITTIDMDTVDLSNLNRQFLFRESDIGKPKAEAAAKSIMKRCPWVAIEYICGRIEDQPDEFYYQFDLAILGLDSIVARRWINDKYCELASWTIGDDGAAAIGYAHPLIDGGTEGFLGNSRLVLIGRTACINCTMWLYPPRTTVPMCTLENVPRLPEHCVIYVKEKIWHDEKPFGESDQLDEGGKKKATPVDGDDPAHIVWIMEKAAARQKQFKLGGTIDFPFTQGVVKNIIPAVGFTNALVAAQCCQEVLKLCTGLAKHMNNYTMYNGSSHDHGVFSSPQFLGADPTCSSCQPPKVMRVSGSDTPLAIAARAMTEFVDDEVFDPSHSTVRVIAKVEGVGEMTLVECGVEAGNTATIQSQPIFDTVKAFVVSAGVEAEQADGLVSTQCKLIFSGGNFLRNRDIIAMVQITNPTED